MNRQFSAIVLIFTAIILSPHGFYTSDAYAEQKYIDGTNWIGKSPLTKIDGQDFFESSGWPRNVLYDAERLPTTRWSSVQFSANSHLFFFRRNTAKSEGLFYAFGNVLGYYGWDIELSRNIYCDVSGKSNVFSPPPYQPPLPLKWECYVDHNARIDETSYSVDDFLALIQERYHDFWIVAHQTAPPTRCKRNGEWRTGDICD